MSKTFSCPGDVAHVISQWRRRRLLTAIDVDLIGNYPEACKLIGDIARRRGHQPEAIERSVLVRLRSDRVDYSIRARSPIASKAGEWS